MTTTSPSAPHGKLIFWLPTFVVLLLGFAACKEDPPVVEPTTGTFELEFAVKWGNNTLTLSQPYPAPDGRNYQVDALKFYVGRVALITTNDSVVNVDDVALVDLYRPGSEIISGTVPTGAYKSLRFNLGLDYEQNHSNQASYTIDHPMSTVTGMYWTWATQYIFQKVEGRADTTGGNNEDIFLYHCGNDSLLRSLEFTGLNINIAEDQSQRHTVILDMQRAFFGTNDTIDVRVDYTTHTTDDPALASRWINAFTSAMQ